MPIGKLMTRGFQNTPYFWILLKIKGAMALQNKAYYFVRPSFYKRWFWTRFLNASWNLLSPFSQLPLVQIGKFQCPSSWEFPKFLGTTLIFHHIAILKGVTVKIMSGEVCSGGLYVQVNNGILIMPPSLLKIYIIIIIIIS